MGFKLWPGSPSDVGRPLGRRPLIMRPLGSLSGVRGPPRAASPDGLAAFWARESCGCLLLLKLLSAGCSIGGLAGALTDVWRAAGPLFATGVTRPLLEGDRSAAGLAGKGVVREAEARVLSGVPEVGPPEGLWKGDLGAAGAVPASGATGGLASGLPAGVQSRATGSLS